MLKIELSEVKLKSGRIILENVHTDISHNTVYSIIGKNGTGKTTFIKSLTSLLDKNLYSVSGKVFYLNRDILSLNKKELLDIRKNHIKYVFQDAINSFDPLKPFKFYFNKLSKNEDELSSHLEYFLLPSRKELNKLYPYEVSGGMAQRINLVLALSAKPRLIILDEPTSGIDSAIANLFIEKIRLFSQQEGNAVILVTHDLNFARRASDSIAFLNNGSLTEFLSPDDFFSTSENLTLQSILNSYRQLVS